jgi:hypothetical protein
MQTNKIRFPIDGPIHTMVEYLMLALGSLIMDGIRLMYSGR